MRMIDVSGNAKLSVKPTITRVAIRLSSICDLFDEVVKKSSDDTLEIGTRTTFIKQ